MKLKDCSWCYEPFIGKGIYCFAHRNLKQRHTIVKTGVCVYCGENCHITKDHVIPRSQGGKTTVESCRRCNGMKSDFSLIIFSYNVRYGIGQCGLLTRKEKTVIQNGIKKVIAMDIKN